METITRQQLLKILDEKKDGEITLKIQGEIDLKITIEKFLYDIEFDIIRIKDCNNDNYIGFNFNEVNYMGKEDEKIICNLNDERDTIIEIMF